MRILLIARLKRLRRHPVPPQVLSRGRALLEARIAEFPARRPAAVAVSYAWTPVMACLVLAVVLTPGALAFAANGALPGDLLYPVKIAVEEARVAVAAGQDARYRLRSAQAERRLIEAEMVIEKGALERQERLERIEVAMDGYAKRLFDLNVMVLTAESRKKGVEASVVRLDQLLERHERLVDSASAAGEPIGPIVLPVKNALELRSNVRELREIRKNNPQPAPERPGKRKSENEDADTDTDRLFEERAIRLRERLEIFERAHDDERNRADRSDEREDRDRNGARLEVEAEAVTLPLPILP